MRYEVPVLVIAYVSERLALKSCCWSRVYHFPIRRRHKRDRFLKISHIIKLYYTLIQQQPLVFVRIAISVL